MKLRRFGAKPEAGTPAPLDHAASEHQRTCPECGALISTRAKTCIYCHADLVAIAKAAARQERAIEQEKRVEAAMRPTLWIVVVVTVVVASLILAIALLGSRQAAIAALTPTMTRAPTRPSLPTATPLPTYTPTPAPTPEQPLEYVVKNGDTPGRIALLYDVSVESLMAFNGKAVDDVIVVGEPLKIPVPTKVSTETPTPMGSGATDTPAAPSERIYIVQAGDTLSGIADQFDVSIEALQQRNQIQDIQTLHVGDQIIIPGSANSSTNTPAPAAVASAGPLTPTPLANYLAVKLLTPLDREIFIGNSSPILLQWLSAGILRSNELYRVQLEQVGSGRPALSLRTRATSWHVPSELFPAPGDPKRVFRWSVEIMRQVGTGSDGAPTYEPVSPASQYSFEWLDIPPTPTPTATLRPGSHPAVLPTATP